MSEKAFWGVSVSTKGGHSKLRGQPLQRHASVWWRCMQMAHGEDLDRLNGGSESSVHFVWGRRTQQDRLEQGTANNDIPMQPSYSLPSRESAQNVAHIGRDVFQYISPLFRENYYFPPYF